MPAKVSGDKFVQLAEESGILAREALDSAIGALSQNGEPPSDADTIADWLVNNDTLTRWQADQLTAGKHTGFVLGKYKLLDRIGSGAMGTVYLAEHSMMHRRCALKVLPSSLVGDSSHLERFLREAEAVGRLNHANIVQAYDIYKEAEGDRNIYFIAMEYIRGVDLRTLTAREKTFDVFKAVDITRQAADGLSHAHEAGLVHRDVKPDNLLVDETGVVKILDLGLAKFFDEDDKASLTLANSESMMGTADYMSPEQALDSHDVDHRSDIYSLGCTLYFMLAGHAPFHEGTVAMRLAAHQSKPPPAIDRPDLPDGIMDIVGRMLEKEPGNRYQSCAELSRELSEWLKEHAGVNWQPDRPEVSANSTPLPPKSGSDTYSEMDLSIIGKVRHSRFGLRFAVTVGLLAVVGLAVWALTLPDNERRVVVEKVPPTGKQPYEKQQEKKKPHEKPPETDPPDPAPPPERDFLVDDQQNRWEVVRTRLGEATLQQDPGSSESFIRLTMPDDESSLRISCRLPKPVTNRPFLLQMDWRSNQFGKAGTVVSLAGWDINYKALIIQAAGGQNQFTMSDEIKGQSLLIERKYEKGRWYRFLVSVEAPDLTHYHVKIIDRGADNRQDVATWFDTHEAGVALPRLTETGRPNQTVVTAGYRGQGAAGYFFDVDNLQFTIDP